MSAFYQIKLHSACICKQAIAGRWERLAFHFQGIKRALKQF